MTDGRADYFEFFDFAQSGQDIVLNAISEERVIFLSTQIFKREHGNALLRRARSVVRPSTIEWVITK